MNKVEFDAIKNIKDLCDTYNIDYSLFVLNKMWGGNHYE